jgi:type IX secretion system substrate protein
MRIGPAIAVLALVLGCFASPQLSAAKEPAARTPPASERLQGPVVEIEGVPIRAAAPGARACGTRDPASRELEGCAETLRRYHEDHGAAAGGVIRVAVHVISAGGEAIAGDQRIAEQIAGLNRAFARTGFRFQLTSVDRSVNAEWFRMGSGTRIEAAAKRTLAVDPAHRLNLYVCAPAQGQMGWASLPFGAPEAHWSHGVVLHHEAFAGGWLARSRSGGTVAHEVGHYLGLYHALEDGVAAPGDDGNEFSPREAAHMRSMAAIYRPSLFGETGADAGGREITAETSLPGDAPRTLEFRGAVPNPFRSETAIRFNVPRAERVRLEIYNVAGQLVRTLMDAHLPPGEHSAMFRAAGLPSGMYFASLRVGGVQMNRSLVLIQ